MNTALARAHSLTLFNLQVMGTPLNNCAEEAHGLKINLAL